QRSLRCCGSSLFPSPTKRREGSSTLRRRAAPPVTRNSATALLDFWHARTRQCPTNAARGDPGVCDVRPVQVSEKAAQRRTFITTFNHEESWTHMTHDPSRANV